MLNKDQIYICYMLESTELVNCPEKAINCILSMNSDLFLKLKTTMAWRFFFLMWIIFKVFVEFVTTLLLFYVLFFCPQGMWDLSSPTRDQTHTPYIGRQTLINKWTVREVPGLEIF